MTDITDEMKVAAVKAYTEVDGKCRPAAMQKALEAALPFLPIAGEGKVKALEWREDQTDDGRQQWHSNDRECITVMGRAFADHERYWLFHAQRGFPSLQEAKAAAQTDYETRILSALISSPGKDGGQEVEAVEWQGRYWIEEENRWSNWITNPVGYPWAHEPQEGKSEIRYLYPQPATTALVESLTKALEAAAEELDRIFCVPPVTETSNLRDQFDLVIAYADRGGRAAHAALSASTSREGESRRTKRLTRRAAS